MQALHFVEEYQFHHHHSASSVSGSLSSSNLCKWKPPDLGYHKVNILDFGYLKVNIDIAFFDNMIETGILARNYLGISLLAWALPLLDKKVM